MSTRNSGKVKIVLTDMVFLMLLFVTAAYVIEMLSKKGLPIESSYIVSIRWGDDSADDIDLHVQDPLNAHVFYHAREAGFMHLDQDDLGVVGDRVVDANGKVRVHARNVEKVELRSVLPGTYVANVHKYKGDFEPTTVSATLYRSVNGQVQKLVNRDIVLIEPWEEKTAFQFRLNESGDVDRIGYDFVSLIDDQ